MVGFVVMFSSSPLSDDDDEDSDQIRGLDWYAKNL